jgi:hypothetical protein
MPFMKTTFFKRSWRGWETTALGYAVITAGLLAAANMLANPAVSTLNINSGVSKRAGYVDGNTHNDAQFHTPIGLAMDNTGDYLYVADRDNNAIRYLDLGLGQTFTFATNSINKPVGVAVDNLDDVFVLNRGNGSNGMVLEFDLYGDLIATNATSLTNAAGIALDFLGNIFVTVNSNTIIKITPGGVQTTVVTIPDAGTSLKGIVVKHNGLIAACDSGRNGIYLINPTSGVVTTNTGFNGAGDNFILHSYYVFQYTGVPKASVKFNQPYGVTEAGDGTLIVTDSGNNRVKVVATTGVVTNLYGINSNLWTSVSYPAWPYLGWKDGTVPTPDQIGYVDARLPAGIVLASDGTVYTTEDYYHIIRHVTGAGFQPPLPWPPAVAPIILTVTTNYGQVTLTWSPVVGAISYNVKRSTSSGSETTIATVSTNSYTDTTVLNGQTYYYVVSAVNAGGEGPPSNEVRATPPLPAVTTPQIGYVDFPATASPQYTSVFHPESSFIFYNDAPIIIVGEAGSQTYYTFGNTSTNGIPDPTSSSASAPSGYQDGLSPSQVAYYSVAQILPDLTIKAIGEKSDGSPNSAIVSARFQFIVGNPSITGDNAAQFTINDITSGAQLWYTTDGSDPTNVAPSQLAGTIAGTNGITLSLSLPSTNLTFKVRGFKDNYQPSAIVSAAFSSTNFAPNTISFGFTAGEASSDFVASPGQTFYAPVTLSVLPGALMYSLQFNLTVTNAGPNPGPPITPGAFGFQSMLMKPLPGTTPVVYIPIPPYMFVANGASPQPTTTSFLYDGNWFESLVFTNTANNLLGVGWLERAGTTNLYDTTKQDLITYSIAHDTIFLKGSGKVIPGGYLFLVPTNAGSGQTYQIQIGRPSATSDGIGAPGSSVFIYAPTNGSLGGGDINSIKNVTIGQRKYIVGNVYPFRWFNAGDFGNTNLQNADVMQVFQSAAYGLDYPPLGSDFFDAMDSCGKFGVLDSATGYYTNAGALTVPQQNALFNGNDTTINQIAFGNGFPLDVCDVYVTYRRSLDSSLTWYRRFWTNGVRVAETVSNVFNPSALKQPLSSGSKLQPATSDSTSVTNQPQVNFACGDITNVSSGQTVHIPITASIFGNYPLRVLMLNLTVVPLDGSPALTTPVQFAPNAALGTPYTTDSTGNGNYAAAWLNSGISGLTGDATLGTLTVTIPANATSVSAYAIHFDHASASPNGIASFPKQTLTGLITLSDRSSSSYNDGIPDSWRLRWFGTTNNSLSMSNACPTGDGVNNWLKYVAGVDPNTPDDFPSLNPKTPLPSGSTAAIYWPTVSGKQYVILRSSNLFSGSWTAIATNTGTGTDMEFDDAANGNVYFYRVQILDQ